MIVVGIAKIYGLTLSMYIHISEYGKLPGAWGFYYIANICK